MARRTLVRIPSDEFQAVLFVRWRDEELSSECVELGDEHPLRHAGTNACRRGINLSDAGSITGLGEENMTVQGRNRSFLKTNRRLFLALGIVAFGGCKSFFDRDQADRNREAEMLFDDDDTIEYVGELANSWGMNPSKVESIAIVTGLDSTGSDPDPSSQRNILVNELKMRQVEDHRELLASPTTSMVIVQGFLPPGIRKGDTYDVFVQVRSDSKTTSLRGGYLMPTELKPMEVLGNQIRQGNIQSRAKGPVMVDALFDASEPNAEVHGVVLGGGVALISRPFGLICHSDVASVEATRMIAAALNRRFHAINNGEKVGVATPKDDQLIELLLPHQYRFHLGRFMQVANETVVDETPISRQARIADLGNQLHEPLLMQRAALRLEAVGDDAIPVLLDALNSPDPEVRFYAAESLAYMGRGEAASVLRDTARFTPEYRFHAMTALASMNDIEAGVALSDLLHEEPAETRYGAFLALRTRSPNDPLIRGELVNDQFFYHVVASNASPLIHFSRSKRPEIVLFGHNQRFGDNFLYVKKGLTLKGTGQGTISITRFTSNEDDIRMTVSTRVDDVLRAMMQFGAGYEELLELIRTGKNMGALDSELAIHAIPDPSGSEERMDVALDPMVAPPTRRFPGLMPELYSDPAKQANDSGAEIPEFEERSGTEPPRKKSFFGRMMPWWNKGA